MVLHLQGRRVVRAEELAHRFEISLRTVYRDIAALGEAGVPIIGEAGVGYSLLRGYNLPPMMLTPEEAAALAIGAQMVRQFGDASVAEPSLSAMDKLRAILPKERQEQVERLAQQTVIGGRPPRPGAEPATRAWLVSVQRGVAERRVLRLWYRARGGAPETIRDVEPLGVVFYDGTWYLVAWCRLRKDYRHFRVDRVQRLELSTETFASRPDFSLKEHLAAESHADSYPARIWLHQRAVERAQHESWATLIEEERREDGVEFTLYTYSLEWLARWLLSFGGDAEAVAPAELRQRVQQEAESALARYRESIVNAGS